MIPRQNIYIYISNTSLINTRQIHLFTCRSIKQSKSNIQRIVNHRYISLYHSREASGCLSLSLALHTLLDFNVVGRS